MGVNSPQVNKKSDDEDGREGSARREPGMVESRQQEVSMSHPFRAGGPNALWQVDTSRDCRVRA